MAHDHFRLLVADWDVAEDSRPASPLEPLARALGSAWSRLLGSDPTRRGHITVGTMSTRWLEQLEHDISKHPDRG
jgi:hypothetical protein